MRHYTRVNGQKLIVARSKIGMTVKLTDLRSSWQPPRGFSDYERFRDDLWDKETRSRLQHLEDREKWHVDQFRLSEVNKKLHLDAHLKILKYRDVLATARPTSLDTEVLLDDRTTRTIREWLASSWEPSEERPYPAGANSLTVNVLLTTSKNTAVISQQGLVNAMSPGIWVASSSGQVDRDDLQDGHLSAEVTARRETNEEIGVPITSVDWLAAMVRLDTGWFALLGEAGTKMTEDEIKHAFHTHATYANEVKDIAFVPLTPQRVAEFLHSRNCGVVLGFHLWLALWRRGFRVEISEIQHELSRD